MKHILKCSECGAYTLKEECGCGGKAAAPKPPKYSPEDKYAEYRRKAKKEQFEKEGLL
ncbi:RNA-protein complex protein Nop10 [Candidatus Woesearchaeota archaeon]|nr:RNA-protein complex protein Nop10 [Candidatus Woesearchaeota archaeon]